MEIREIKENKWAFRELLFLADEQEDKIEAYLFRGTMFVGYVEGKAVTECIVTREAEEVIEVQSLAVLPSYQRKGLGKEMLAFIEEQYKNACRVIRIWTGDSRLTVPFYERCGYLLCGRDKNYFPTHYRCPIYECGKLLTDRVCFEKNT